MLLLCGLSKSVAQRVQKFSNTARGRKKLPTPDLKYKLYHKQITDIFQTSHRPEVVHRAGPQDEDDKTRPNAQRNSGKRDKPVTSKTGTSN